MIRRLVAMILAVFAMPATSQVIERMRLTDNDLSCAQMYGEAQQMEMLVANASRLPSPAGGGNANVGAQAQARKEYLTQLFLSRGCRVSDLPK
jgi:hypothetical protein